MIKSIVLNYMDKRIENITNDMELHTKNYLIYKLKGNQKLKTLYDEIKLKLENNNYVREIIKTFTILISY